MNCRRGCYGSARAEALARIDRLYDCKTLIFVDLSFDPTYAEILVERFGPERVIGLQITSSGDGMTLGRGASKTAQSASTPLAVPICSIFCTVKCTTIKFASLMDANSRRAYEQLMTLEIEYRQNGMIYDCPSGRHDDLAISCAMLVWAAQHPHLEYWTRAVGATCLSQQTTCAQCESLDVTLV